jgi:hypothetical protein
MAAATARHAGECTSGTVKEAGSCAGIAGCEIFASWAATSRRKLVSVAPVIIGTAVADWALKILAVSSDQQIAFHWFDERQHPWLVVILAVGFAGAITTTAQTRLSIVGVGVVVGALLGDYGELAAFGRVTDFIACPADSACAPADLFSFIGWLLFALSLRIPTLTNLCNDRGP